MWGCFSRDFPIIDNVRNVTLFVVKAYQFHDIITSFSIPSQRSSSAAATALPRSAAVSRGVSPTKSISFTRAFFETRYDTIDFFPPASKSNNGILCSITN